MRVKFSTLLLFMVVASVAVGLLIPAYYDWTGSDQSRPSPLLLPTAIGILLAGIGCCAALAWISFPSTSSDANEGKPHQFSIQMILVLTAVVAVLLAAFGALPKGLLSGILLSSTLSFLAHRCYRDHSSRLPVATMLSAMYFPYAWIFTWRSAQDAFPEILWMGWGLPAFFHLMLLGGLFEQHSSELTWFSTLLTTVMLAIGIWMIQLGRKRLLVYLIFLLISSVYGSFILNALVRM